MTVIRCAGCNHPFKTGDHYIIDSSSGFTNDASDPVVDDTIAGIFGSSDGNVRICEDCTEPGDKYTFETFVEPSA